MDENNNFLNGTPTEETAKKTRKPRTKKADIPLTETTEVIPTDDFIVTELAKFNIADATIAQWKEEYGKLTITGVEDKTGYEILNTARTFVKKKRIEVEKVGKEMRSNAIKFQKAVIEEEKRIIGLIDPLETYLEEEKAKIDNEKKRLDEEKETKEQVILQERAVKLIACGCSFTGDAYTLDDIRISVLSVKTSDAFTWTALFAAVETKHKENQEIKAREDELRLQAEENNKKILEAALAKEEEMKKKEAEIAAREAAIQAAELKAKQEAEARIKAQEEAAKKLQEDRIKSRKSSLYAIGFASQGDQFLHLGMNVPESEVINLSDTEWSTLIEQVSAESARIKKVMEEQRIAKEAEDKRLAEEAAVKRLLEEQQADAIAAKEKAEAEAKELARQESLKPDIDKFNSFCKSVMEVSIPKFSTEPYKAFAEVIKVDRINILKTLHSKKPV